MKKTHWLRNTLIVLAACALVGVTISAILFFKNPDPTRASASIQLTFDGAAEGKAPNGSRYNLDGVTSDEVLSGALEAAGLSGTYTPDQIRDYLTVSGSYPEDIVKQMMSYESLLDFSASRSLTLSQYFPTLYTISLTSDFDKGISQANLEGLLKQIVTVFQAHFIRTYSCGQNDVKINFNLDDFDYPQQLAVINQTIDEVATYAEELYELAPSLAVGGQGFNDITVRLNNLKESELSRLSASITMNALTRNVVRLLTQYQFEIRQLNNELEKKNAELEKLDQLVASYSKNEIIYLSTSDNITKIDGNSSETYDSLVTARKEVADEITEIKSKITTYQLQLSDLLQSEGTEETAATISEETATISEETAAISEETAAVLEKMQEASQEELAAAAEAAQEAAAARISALEKSIDEVVAKREAIITDFNALIQAYNDQHLNDLTVNIQNYSYNSPKLFSGAFIKKAIKVTGPICALGFMVCMILIFISKRKQSKAL